MTMEYSGFSPYDVDIPPWDWSDVERYIQAPYRPPEEVIAEARARQGRTETAAGGFEEAHKAVLGDIEANKKYGGMLKAAEALMGMPSPPDEAGHRMYIDQAASIISALNAHAASLGESDPWKSYLTGTASSLYQRVTMTPGPISGGGGGGGYAPPAFASTEAGMRLSHEQNLEYQANQLAQQRAEMEQKLAQAKMQSHMQGLEMVANARNAGMQQFGQLLPYGVAPGQEYMLGREPGGVAEQLYGRAGMQYNPQPVQRLTFNPNQFVNPTQQAATGFLSQYGMG